MKLRESTLSNLWFEPLQLNYEKKMIAKKFNKQFVKFIKVAAVLIVIIFILLDDKNLKIDNMLTLGLLYLILVWGSVIIIKKLLSIRKIKLIDSRIENIKEQEKIIKPKIEAELRPIYEQWWKKPPDWGERRSQVYQRDRGICQQCGINIPGTFHVHHKTPQSKPEGDHSLKNLLLLCPKCHSKIDSPGHQLIKPVKKRRKRRPW
jgi:hypothetical protein